MSRLIIVISTGQNISNLPPILEVADGTAQVLLLETQYAQKHRWSIGLCAVLESYNIPVLQRIALSDHPHEVFQTLQHVQYDAMWQAHQLYLICNGGQKLVLAAVIEALNTYCPVLLYGNAPKANFTVYEKGLRFPAQTRTYQDERLALADIFICAGYQLFDHDHEKIWPAEPIEYQDSYGFDELSTILALTGRSPTQADKDFMSVNDALIDLLNTVEVTDLVSLKAAFKQHKLAFSNLYTALLCHLNLIPGSFVDFNVAMSLPHVRVGKWQNSLLNVFSKARSELKNTGSVTLAALSNQIKFFINSSNDLFKVQGIRKRSHKTTVSDTKAKGEAIRARGHIFEQAVAYRVQQWLLKQNHDDLKRWLRSVWTSVKVCSNEKPEEIQAEFDILLVLKNGIMLNLEVKSGSNLTKQGGMKKDFDARLLKTQTVSSGLATVAVCGQLYTNYSQTDWFEDQHKYRTWMEQTVQRRFIPFTFEGQPSHYTLKEFPDQVFTCDAFEQALKTWLSPYSNI